MQGVIRSVLIVLGLVVLVLALGFYIQSAWAIWMWPWPDGRLSYSFVASILAATAVPVIWIGISGELSALASGALDLTLTYAGIGIYLFAFYGDAAVLPYAIGCGIAFGFNLAIYLFSRRISTRDPRATPRLLRLIFIFFVIVLVLVSAALLLQAPHVFPWPLKPGTSVLIGCVFLGAAVYFLHGVIFPRWSNACGQLLGFLAYDMVLLWRYLAHFSSVKPEHLLSLIVYVAVLVFSAVVAIYFLFIHPATRLIRPRPLSGVSIQTR